MVAPASVDGLPRVGRHVRLRAVDPSDLGDLYRLEVASPAAVRWRFRGRTPSPEEHARSVWAGVTATFVVASNTTNAVLGLVSMYDYSAENQIAFISAIGQQDALQSGLMVEAAVLFLDYCFRVWNLRRVYLDAPEYNMDQFASVATVGFAEEGRMIEAEFFDGRYWDRVFLGISRDRWALESPRFVRAARSSRQV